MRFMLQPDSPEINQGVSVAGHPGKDLSGNPVTGKPDRGAFEFETNN